MRTTLKIILPLIVSVAAVSLLFAAYQVRTEKRNLRSYLSRRAEILSESLEESVEPLLDRLPKRNLQRLVERFGQREHLKGVAVYNSASAALAITPGLAPAFRSRPTAVSRAAQEDTGVGEFRSAEQTDSSNKEAILIQVYALPLHSNGEIADTLTLFNDTSYIDKQVSRTLRDSLLTAFIQTLLLLGLVFILVLRTFTGPLTRTAKWLRTLRTGRANAPLALSNGDILDEINHEVMHLARDLSTARAAAEEEARLRDSNASLWTAERLHVSLRSKLQDKPFFVVPNREVCQVG
jgi:trehalose 6-phosphate synthase